MAGTFGAQPPTSTRQILRAQGTRIAKLEAQIRGLQEQLDAINHSLGRN